MRKLAVGVFWGLFCVLACSCARDSSFDDSDREIMQKAIARNLERKPSKGPAMVAKAISAEEIAERLALENVNLTDPAFTFVTSGFQPGDSYDFYMLNMLYKKVSHDQYIVNDEGKLVAKKNGYYFDNSLQFGNGFMNAEPKFAILLSSDKKTCLATTIVSKPVEFAWTDGAHIQLIMLSPDACQFNLVGTGFLPNESLTMCATSCQERLEGACPASSEGTIQGLILPAVVNQPGGNATIEIKRQNGDIGTLNYFWGLDAMKEAMGGNARKLGR